MSWVAGLLWARGMLGWVAAAAMTVPLATIGTGQSPWSGRRTADLIRLWSRPTVRPPVTAGSWADEIVGMAAFVDAAFVVPGSRPRGIPRCGAVRGDSQAPSGGRHTRQDVIDLVSLDTRLIQDRLTYTCLSFLGLSESRLNGLTVHRPGQSGRARPGSEPRGTTRRPRNRQHPNCYRLRSNRFRGCCQRAQCPQIA